MNLKIALAGLLYEKSSGDRLLIECTKYLCRKKFGNDIKFSEIDFYGRKKIPEYNQNKNNSIKPVNTSAETKILNFASRYNINYIKNVIYKRQYNKFLNSDGTKIYMKKYFDEQLENVDIIIFLGGGTIKYDVRVDFGKYYRRIANAAKEKNIPIVVFCAGIESKYNSYDGRCVFFSKTLSDDIFKIISTRDDINELRKYVKNPKTEILKVADIGVWSSDTYNIKRKNTNKIGIGIIVADRFTEFGKNISKDLYDYVMVDTIKKLEARGDIVEIFNNGDPQDRIYAEHISELAGKSAIDVKTANSPEELVNILSNYKGIISSRLHSCIPSYSLDIPFIAISWNNKLQYFADNIGVPERVINFNDFNSNTIIKKFDKALNEKYDTKFRDEYKKSDLLFLDNCLKYIR